MVVGWGQEADVGAAMTRDEFILYDTFKNIGMLVFFKANALMAIGGMGMATVWCCRKPERVARK